MAVKAVAAVDSLGPRVDRQTGKSLPPSPWPAANTSPCGGLFQQPAQRVVAGAQQVRRHARPVDVHVDRQRGRRRR